MTDAARRIFSRQQTVNYTSANERRAAAALQPGPDNQHVGEPGRVDSSPPRGQIRLLHRPMKGAKTFLSPRYFP
jgi:hypothetical protein